MYDYQGRSYLHIPQDVGVNLRSTVPPEKCYLPKKQIHVWSGHTKGVSAVRLFPLSGHLLLSCSMDCKIKLWEVYGDRRCLRTFIGNASFFPYCNCLERLFIIINHNFSALI
ncbi:cell division cycle 40 [Phyllostomus discolor]|uniref:Cell division cycle 40 n=1 Tax=Phyllostomus discolor TaxID=89673 RepID=A0A834AIS4_9CHIR|nr:cell division cycle 40 [Phyllostomus discolor]